MYFCGSWRQLTKVSSFRDGATKPGEGAFDVNYVEVDGKGVYVGDTLTIFNGTDAWWGEGDEKIFVDNEAFPSHVGTGTEDYYGYAWCRPEYFQSPFHAQPIGCGKLHAGAVGEQPIPVAGCDSVYRVDQVRHGACGTGAIPPSISRRPLSGMPGRELRRMSSPIRKRPPGPSGSEAFRRRGSVRRRRMPWKVNS